jgi:hypothetical protein
VRRHRQRLAQARDPAIVASATAFFPRHHSISPFKSRGVQPMSATKSSVISSIRSAICHRRSASGSIQRVGKPCRHANARQAPGPVLRIEQAIIQVSAMLGMTRRSSRMALQAADREASDMVRRRSNSAFTGRLVGQGSVKRIVRRKPGNPPRSPFLLASERTSLVLGVSVGMMNFGLERSARAGLGGELRGATAGSGLGAVRLLGASF